MFLSLRRSSLRFSGICGFAGLVACLESGGAVAAASDLSRYSVAELPSAVDEFVSGFGLTDDGVVTGTIGVPDFLNPTHLPFVGPPAGPLSVDNGLGLQFAFTQSMNSLGGIAGNGYYLMGEEWRPTLFRKTHDGPMVEIGFFDGASGGTFAMNDAGEVVGYWTISISSTLGRPR